MKFTHLHSVLQYNSLCRLLCLMLFAYSSGYAQLNDFELDIAVTNESCNGNGTLTFTAQNTTPGANILYTGYLNPDMGTPVFSSPNNFVAGLGAGTYTIIALQTLGSESNTVEKQVTIQNIIPPELTYELVSAANSCGGGGQLTVNVLTGTATLYEIISGPVIVSPQTSNIFTGLTDGFYNIRVYDQCNQGIVTSYNVVLNPSPPVVSAPIFEDVLSGTDCTSVTITNTISYPPGTVISYPLTVVYTVHPGDGSADIVTTQTFTSGAPSLFEFTHDFTLVPGQPSTYDLVVTNGCNMQFTNTGMATTPTPSLSGTKVPIPCGKYYLSLTAVNYMPPYTLSFTSPPAGFNPVLFNDGHPGPFTDGGLSYGGENNPVPEGTYNVTLTDACGRTAQTSVIIIYEVPEPSVSGRNNGCFSDLGKIVISVPDRKIVFAEIIGAPAAYTQPLPFNVTALINATGILVINNLPLGTYTIHFIDECGQNYIKDVVVPPFTELDFTGSVVADCTIGIGGVHISSSNGKLTAMNITAAPAAFDGILPLDVSNLIDSSGNFYMDNLPQGTYTFSGTDICGIHRTLSLTVVGYVPSAGIPFAFLPHCNSFDIEMSDADTSGMSPTYWLQKENPDVPGQWMHPDTAVAYPEGTTPTDTNSVSLVNNLPNYNFSYSGTFRIIKSFESVGSGKAVKICLEALGDTFVYQYDVTINEIYTLSCLSSPNNVYVEATGLAPLTYSITEKDGLPFVVNNGTNNIFSGLDPAVYVFRVDNSCGEFQTATRDINLLPNLVAANTPDDQMMCIEPAESGFQEFDLSQLNAQILGNQSQEVYTISYYLTNADAENAVNPLPYLYTNTSNPQIIYARLEHNYIHVCHGIVSFGLKVSENPDVHMDEEAFICSNGGSAILSADPGYDSYTWSTGQNTPSITVFEPGVYTVTIGRVYGTAPPCTVDVAVLVSPSGPADAIAIETEDWTDDDNKITVITTGGEGNFEYSLDDIVYQESPVFDNLETGIYTVYIRDKAHCSTVMNTVLLLNYPKFFTPNGDGSHETWMIKYSWLEPDMLTYIYDRFGKLITSFSPHSGGWDGTFHGQPLPSTDYWFVVKRQNGEIHKGHFSLIR